MEFIKPEEFKVLADILRRLEIITEDIRYIGEEPRYGRDFAGVTIKDGELVLILKDDEWNEFSQRMVDSFDFIPLHEPSFSLESQLKVLKEARDKRYSEYLKLKSEFEQDA